MDTVVLTAAQIERIISSNIANSKFALVKLPGLVVYRLAKMLVAIELEWQSIVKARESVINKFAARNAEGNIITDEMGRVQWDKGKEREAIEELSNLRKMEIDLGMPPVELPFGSAENGDMYSLDEIITLLPIIAIPE